VGWWESDMTAKHTQKIRAMDSGVLLTAYENENILTFVGAVYNVKTNFPGKLYEYWSIDYDVSQLGKGPIPQK